MKNKVFISYSHEDREYLERLIVHLKPLEKDKIIIAWSDKKIQVGDDWKKEIENSLKECRIAILLISADFLASGFINDNELPTILDKSGKKELSVIPVIIKPCSFKSNKRLSRYHAINDPEKPLVELNEAEQEKIWTKVYDTIVNHINKPDKTENGLNNDFENPSLDETKIVESYIIEEGIGTNTHGETIITIPSTVLFDNRISGAFPGIRGLKWFEKPERALKHLEILLKYPIKFDHCNGHGVSTTPFFYFRGYANQITDFQMLTNTRFLINSGEMELDRICVFRSESYWQNYIYVEIKADTPSGANDITKDSINNMIQSRGFADEEYGLFQDTCISRTCYDDKAAIINGEITDTSKAVLRRRFLTPYNFLIASQFSPINSSEFDSISEPILNSIIMGKDRFEKLHETILNLRRNEREFSNRERQARGAQ